MSSVKDDDEVTQITKWNTSLRGLCRIYSRLGVYYGYPLEFTANSFLKDSTEKARTFNSYGSIGLISAPWSVISFVAGVSFLKTHESEAPDQLVYAFTLGVGGNLDIFTSLLNP